MVKKGGDHVWEWWNEFWEWWGEWGTLVCLIIAVLVFIQVFFLDKKNKK